ncbi:nucleoside 2-deoxyribosyltransferase [Caulobacter sp. 17J80-11]|uniref:nucleoside 2-deoxyribosyltransferase n=1 Tax=Caulobacter sp. 17J80-11 TaxID=2763502 RepID=UPI0016539F52|nr:nucleoside 2-deoxyribosyltransferase [Caulobacter sp. 17J80-11]MBC6981067.1 nucleoside 2-deoxyribosyltransferase [Caulobacter sp. 17J80-11]
MRRISTVCLLGPDLWFPEAEEHARRQRDLCDQAGFVGITALDHNLVETEPSEAMAREIYAESIARIRRCDAVVANLTPWRGPGCDAGTAFEVGFAAALGKPVFAYLNVVDEEEADHRDRVERMIGAEIDADGEWRDSYGCTVEDFGLPENLMLWAEARRLYVIVTPDPLRDLTGLELVLDALKLYAD